MINLDSLTLKLLINEYNDEFLTGGRVQKVQQPSKSELLINIRAKGGNHKLYINVNAKYPHIAVISKEGEKLRNITIPDKPPMFCMLLRKYMEGAKINEIRQPDNERIFEIYFESYNELGDRVSFVLAVELMGKHSNIVLYSYETNVILGCVKPISSEKSRERELAGGMPYVYPPKQKKIDFLSLSKEEFYKMASLINMPINKWLNKFFYNISLAFANEICSYIGIKSEIDGISAISANKINSLYDLIYNLLTLNSINPSISYDKQLFSLFAIDKTIEWQSFNTINSMVEHYFGYHVHEDIVYRGKERLFSAAKKELKRLNERKNEFLKKINSSEKEEKYKQYGDLILANLYKIKSGMTKVQVENFFDDNRSVSIPLEPLLSPNENAQRYYKLYNKVKSAAKVSKDFYEQALEDIKYLNTVYLSIEQAQNIFEIDQIRDELAEQNIIKSLRKEDKKKKGEKISVFEYISKDGYTILIGKNNKQNDYIVSKLALPNDIWVHVQNMPGSHILIRADKDKKEEIPYSTLEEAILLAAYFSEGRNSSNVPVMYTKRKFLKKPPAAKPGYVIYSNETTLYATTDISLLDEKQLEKMTVNYD